MFQLRRPQGPFVSTYSESIRLISPEGLLLYAIGDIHGRSDLLTELIAMIRADAALQAPARRPTLVLLGDYVDRGPASDEVIDTVLSLTTDHDLEVVALRGNHDQFILDFFDDPMRGPVWMNFGGAATLVAYGVTPPRRSDAATWMQVSRDLAAAVPPAHIAFLQSLPYCAVAGEYLFVHAGVRPKTTLQSQRLSDLLSIRDDFLRASTPLPGFIVVFGHTPFDCPLIEAGKIGLDTGACATGVLTALCVHNGRRRLLQTGSGGGVRDAEVFAGRARRL